MAPMDDFPELRADLPALEPDDVLLAQLVGLSAASTAAAAAARPLRPVRALAMGGAALGLVATTSWIAGALPGVPSPIAPLRDHHPAPPSPPLPARSDGAPVPSAGTVTATPDASRPHPAASGAADLPTATWTPPGPPSAPPTPGEGRAVGRGDAKHPDAGRHAGGQADRQQGRQPGRHSERQPAQPAQHRPDVAPSQRRTERQRPHEAVPSGVTLPLTPGTVLPRTPKPSLRGPSHREASTGP